MLLVLGIPALIAVVAVVCILAVTFLGRNASSKFSSVGTAVGGPSTTTSSGGSSGSGGGASGGTGTTRRSSTSSSSRPSTTTSSEGASGSFGAVASTVTTVTPSAAAATSDGSLFFTTVHREVPGITRADAERVAKAACADIAAKGVDKAMRGGIVDALDGQLSARDVGVVVGAGVTEFCPSNLDEFIAWAKKQSGG
ncbi:MAG: hypothetical protein U0Q07_12180 [Acidimicrobiales bacterium]